MKKPATFWPKPVREGRLAHCRSSPKDIRVVQPSIRQDRFIRRYRGCLARGVQT